MENQKPRIGVGVIVKRNGKVLLGKRKGSHGEGFWAFPGGHLEFNEEVEDCAKREVAEEAGIEIKNLKREFFTNDILKDDDKHYVTLFVSSEYDSGDVCIMEPEKCDEWGWFHWNELPQPLFIPIANLIKESFDPFEDK